MFSALAYLGLSLCISHGEVRMIEYLLRMTDISDGMTEFEAEISACTDKILVSHVSQIVGLQGKPHV